MSGLDALIPELNWLAASAEPEEDGWNGPPPCLVNLTPWIDHLSSAGHRTLVAATYAAAEAARQHWDRFLLRSPKDAMESILQGQPPPVQLAAVRRWLDSPTTEHKNLAAGTVDRTKQLYWFHQEFEDRWFEEPGVWAVESSEFCVMTLTGDPYGRSSVEWKATVCLICAINSFRTSAEQEIREPVSVVLEAIRRQLGKTN